MNDLERLEITEPVGPDGYDPVWDNLSSEDGFGPQHYDRSGNPISMRQWLMLRLWDEQHGRAYIRVASDQIGDYWISTVWIGLDHGFGFPWPLIFETMVFKDSHSDLDCERYSTEAKAIAGHMAMVEKVKLFDELKED